MNTPEQIPQEVPAYNVDSIDNFKSRMLMQADLVVKFYGFKDRKDLSDDQKKKWIEDHAANFSVVLRQHPECLKKYQEGEVEKDQAKKDEALHMMEEVLYVPVLN